MLRGEVGWVLTPVKPVVVSATIVAFGVAAYLVARDTSVFAVRTEEVRSGAREKKDVRQRTWSPELGRSLLRVDEGALTQQLDALPDVLSATFERSFPNTLIVTVHGERAVLLVRQGSKSWVVSASGRVMRKVGDPRRSRLPLLSVRKSVQRVTGRRSRSTRDGRRGRRRADRTTRLPGWCASRRLREGGPHARARRRNGGQARRSRRLDSSSRSLGGSSEWPPRTVTPPRPMSTSASPNGPSSRPHNPKVEGLG